MFDIGFWEMAVIGTIMLIVLGPERLPGVARTAGFWLGKLRRMVSDVKSEVKREMDAAELKELDDAKNQIQEASKTIHKQMNKDLLADADVVDKSTDNKTAGRDGKDELEATAPAQTTPSTLTDLESTEQSDDRSSDKKSSDK